MPGNINLAFSQDRGAARIMDGSIDSATANKIGICGVHDGFCLLLRDVRWTANLD